MVKCYECDSGGKRGAVITFSIFFSFVSFEKM